jgi:hypothetical protein
VSLLFLAESFLAALYLSQLIADLPGHDAAVVAVILARGVVGALQFTAGWLLRARRATGIVVARWALVCAATWVLLAVGLDLAPTSVYPWWRWQATAAYGLYAAALFLTLNRFSKDA